MKMLLNGEGVKAALLASRAALTPSPFAVVRATANSFLPLGRRPVLGYGCIPEGGQTSIDFFPQPQGIGLLIERMQAPLLLLTENSSRQEALIGRLGFIPFAPHLVALDDFFAEMHHRL